MLTLKILKLNLWTLRFSSWFGFIPFDVSGSRIHISKFHFIHEFWILCSVLHSFYLAIRLVPYVKDTRRELISNLPLHVICFIGGMNANFWSVKILVCHGDTFSKIFNSVMLRLPKGKFLPHIGSQVRAVLKF